MTKKLTALEAAENYIRSEPSDPFLRWRVYAHMQNGISSDDANYFAQPHEVERQYKGIDGELKTYVATEYHSRRRPNMDVTKTADVAFDRFDELVLFSTTPDMQSLVEPTSALMNFPIKVGRGWSAEHGAEPIYLVKRDDFAMVILADFVNEQDYVVVLSPQEPVYGGRRKATKMFPSRDGVKQAAQTVGWLREVTEAEARHASAWFEVDGRFWVAGPDGGEAGQRNVGIGDMVHAACGDWAKMAAQSKRVSEEEAEGFAPWMGGDVAGVQPSEEPTGAVADLRERLDFSDGDAFSRMTEEELIAGLDAIERGSEPMEAIARINRDAEEDHEGAIFGRFELEPDPRAPQPEGAEGVVYGRIEAEVDGGTVFETAEEAAMSAMEDQDAWEASVDERLATMTEEIKALKALTTILEDTLKQTHYNVLKRSREDAEYKDRQASAPRYLSVG